MVKIAPSILGADFARLGEQTREALQAGAEWIHMDIMDGHFVPNITMGPMVVRALRPIVDEFNGLIDVHLMIETPERYLDAFAKAGADVLTVHIEAVTHLHRTVHAIKDMGLKAGVALNPATPLSFVEEILSDLDLLLIMTVNPGFAGQSFIPAMLDKLARARQMLDQRGLSHIELEADGGIKPSNAADVVRAGATVLVSASGVFNKKASIADNMDAFRAAIASAAVR